MTRRDPGFSRLDVKTIMVHWITARLSPGIQSRLDSKNEYQITSIVMRSGQIGSGSFPRRGDLILPNVARVADGLVTGKETLNSAPSLRSHEVPTLVYNSNIVST